MNRKAPANVQQWVDTLPSMTPATPNSPSGAPYPGRNKFFGRDMSVQSDDCSHCSSVESVLELRKPDPEAVLIGLGFGPSNSTTCPSRIPDRFLQPSKLLKHIDINKFMEQQGNPQMLDQFVSGPSSPARAPPKTC